MPEPVWLNYARSHVGEHEIAGRRHNPKILQWWAAIRAPFSDDETPWCAAFVGGILEACDLRSSRSAAARSYLKWGQKLDGAVLGAVVVFERGPTHGHVGFVVGRDTRGFLMVLGGNQGDRVSIAPFSLSRLLGYRWPAEAAKPPHVGMATLPTLASSAPVSKNEA